MCYCFCHLTTMCVSFNCHYYSIIRYKKLLLLLAAVKVPGIYQHINCCGCVQGTTQYDIMRVRITVVRFLCPLPLPLPLCPSLLSLSLSVCPDPSIMLNCCCCPTLQWSGGFVCVRVRVYVVVSSQHSHDHRDHDDMIHHRKQPTIEQEGYFTKLGSR